MDTGERLYFVCRPPENLISYHHSESTNFPAAADLFLDVTSALRPDPSYNNRLDRYTIPGDKQVEKQIRALLDPDNSKYTGILPDAIEYRLVPCNSISISLYDSAGKLVSDMTDKAHFHVRDNVLNGGYILIDSSKKVIGLMKNGMTIKEYLDYHPMIFSEVDLFFDGFDRKYLLDGYYFKTVVSLDDGRVMESDSKDIYGSTEK